MVDKKDNDQIGRTDNAHPKKNTDDSARRRSETNSQKSAPMPIKESDDLSNELGKTKNDSITRKEHDDTNHPHEFDTPSTKTENRAENENRANDPSSIGGVKGAEGSKTDTNNLK